MISKTGLVIRFLVTVVGFMAYFLNMRVVDSPSFSTSIHLSVVIDGKSFGEFPTANRLSDVLQQMPTNEQEVILSLSRRLGLSTPLVSWARWASENGKFDAVIDLIFHDAMGYVVEQHTFKGGYPLEWNVKNEANTGGTLNEQITIAFR